MVKSLTSIERLHFFHERTAKNTTHVQPFVDINSKST